MANINVHESIVRRTLNNNGVHGRVAKRKPLLSKNNIAARLQFAKDHKDKPERFWKKKCWTDEMSGLGRLASIDGTMNSE